MEEKKKKKKHHVGLIVTLVILFVVIVLPISLTYILFYDATTTSFVGDDNVSTESMLKKKTVSAFSDSKTSGKIDLAIEQNDLNQLLYGAYKEMPSQASQYVKKFYCDVEGKQYTFSFDAEVPLFKSRLRLVTTLDDYSDDSGRGIYFKIDDIKIGRTGGLKSIATSIASNFITDADLTKMFASTGLNMKVSLADAKITYARGDYIADLKKMIGGSNALVTSMLDTFFDNNLASLEPEGGIDVLIDLAKLHTNSAYCDPTHTLDIDVPAIGTNIKTLLKGGIVDDDQTKLGYVMNYLVRGYDLASSSAQSYISGKDLTSIGIADVEAYDGANLASETTITDALKNRINLTDIAQGKIGYIDETDINDTLQSVAAIGQGIVLDYVDSSDALVSCVCIDDLYANIFNNHIYLTLGLSINGYETSIVFDTAYKGLSDYVMTLEVSDLYFGTLSASEDLQSYLFDLMESSFSGDSEFFFDSATGVFTVDVKAAIENADATCKAAITAAMATGKELKATLTGSALADNGTIQVTIE